MKNNRRVFVDVHVLQTVPPSCVNRDDTGSPKTAIYGGVTRARVSSQSWKRAMRLFFNEIYGDDERAFRTKKIAALIEKEILKNDPSAANACEMAVKLLANAGVTVKKQKDGDDYSADALFFMSAAQAKALADIAADHPDSISDKPSKETKAAIAKAICDQPGIDIALFGRMVASDPSLNTDACAQVAHGISTHRISNEYDYFTAVDDVADEDNAGAAHLGTVEYNSSTLYRYATVAVHELQNYLGGDTVDAVKSFVRAFVCSMPDGKQNTFANRTLPDAVMVAVRLDQPVNLVGAFEKPVPASAEGYALASAKRLASHAREVYEDYASEPALTLVTGKSLSELADPRPFNLLIEALGSDIGERIKKDGE